MSKTGYIYCRLGYKSPCVNYNLNGHCAVSLMEWELSRFMFGTIHQMLTAYFSAYGGESE